MNEVEKNGDNPNPTVAHNEISSNGQKEIYETSVRICCLRTTPETMRIVTVRLEVIIKVEIATL